MDNESIIMILEKLEQLANTGDLDSIKNIIHVVLHELNKDTKTREKEKFDRAIEHGDY